MAILVLTLRRLPIVLALYKWIPAIHNWREAVFTGWFGPIGVGAIFYYTVALEALPEDGPNTHARALLQPVIYFMVLASVIAHGVTIPLFYIGTFATRTLTITSEKGNQVLRIPKIESLIGRKQSPAIIDEVYKSDLPSSPPLPPSPPLKEDIDRDVPKKHTAITILTPQIPEHVHNPNSSNNNYTVYHNNNNNYTKSNNDDRLGVAGSATAVQVDEYDIDDDDESISYLPISRKSSLSHRSKS